MAIRINKVIVCDFDRIEHLRELEMILTLIAEAVLGTVVEQAGETIKQRFTSEPAQKAFAIALGKAVNDYIRVVGGGIAQPLLQDEGILTLPLIQAELAQIIRFERDPDPILIGQMWRDALNTYVGPRDFTRDAKMFLDCLETRLKETETFRSVFMLRQLDAIAEKSIVSADELSEIRQQLTNLMSLANGLLGQMAQKYDRAATPIKEHIKAFDAWYYVENKTRDFVGREYVFRAVDSFLQSNSSGYILIEGYPGCGKSAISAQLVKQRGYSHHFNIRAGTNKPSHFLANLCAQLIARYELPYESLPATATQDGIFLWQLLREVAEQLHGNQCVIVVDALDEVEAGVVAEHNILHLPSLLPSGIYFILTLRREKNIILRMECPHQRIQIKQDDELNLADIRQFVALQMDKPGIQTYMEKNAIDTIFMADFLSLRSEGNFMYVRLVLPEIEHGVYQDLALEQLPFGLVNYYESHWQRMRRQNELDWYDYKLPVIVALTTSKEPVPLAILSEFAGVKDTRRVRGVLQDWDQFLYRTENNYRGVSEIRYRWYHSSFFDFVARKQEVAEERVNFQESYRRGLNAIIQELGWSE